MGEGMAASMRRNAHKRIDAHLFPCFLHKLIDRFGRQVSAILREEIIIPRALILEIADPRPLILHKPFADDGILRNDTLLSPLPIDHEIALPNLRGLHINNFTDAQPCVEQHHKHKTISDTQIIAAIIELNHPDNLAI